MNFKEMVEEVSSRSGVAAGAVKKVLDATFTTVADQLAADKPVRLQGFGTFLRRAAKNNGEARVVFRQWLTKDQRKTKKQNREARGATATTGAAAPSGTSSVGRATGSQSDASS